MVEANENKAAEVTATDDKKAHDVQYDDDTANTGVSINQYLSNACMMGACLRGGLQMVTREGSLIFSVLGIEHNFSVFEIVIIDVY